MEVYIIRNEADRILGIVDKEYLHKVSRFKKEKFELNNIQTEDTVESIKRIISGFRKIHNIKEEWKIYFNDKVYISTPDNSEVDNMEELQKLLMNLVGVYVIWDSEFVMDECYGI